jgi:hypothetical protein
MVKPSPGFIWGADRQQALESLHFAHAGLGRLAGLDQTVESGV